LFHGLYENDSTAYTVQTSMDFEKGLKVELLNKAMNFVINNHSILRSTFLHDQFKIPVQCVYHHIDIPFIEVDYSALDDEEQVEAVRQYMETDYKTDFDFVAPPLMRLILIKLGDERYKLIWTYHHILMDGWSMPILMEEILRTYESLLNNVAPQEMEADHFEDYVNWINSKDKQEERRFWENYLEGFDTPNLLSVNHKAARNKGGEELQTQSLQFDFECSSTIRQFAKNNRLTVNTLIQGVWSLLLAKYTGSQDVVYGVTVTDRPAVLGNAEKRVGMFINTIPLRCSIDPQKKVVDWFLDLQTNHASSKDFQSTSVSDIQRWANISGDFFDSILVFENYPMDAALASCDFLEIKNYQLREATNYLLTIDVKLEDKLQIDFTFNEDLIAEEKVKGFSEQFYSIIEQIVLMETNQLADIKLLNDSEKTMLLAFNQTEVAYPQDQTLVDLFEQQVERTPQSTALVCGDASRTYTELNEAANQLANYLSKEGIGKEDLVIVGMDRSIELIISLLAVLKCGAAYVPVDPSYPKQRIDLILEDTAAKLILSQEEHVAQFQANENGRDYRCLLVDQEWPLIEMEDKQSNDFELNANQLAYVMYTSGSTGQPKGVMIEHQSLVNYFHYSRQTYGTDIDHFNFPLFTSLSFDLTQTSLWLPLISGGQLFVENEEGLGLIIDNIVENKALNAIKLTPSHALLFEGNEQPSNIKVAIVGGEALKANHLAKLRSLNPEIRIFNEYGPTEATIGCIVDEVKNDRRIVIGQPIFNTQIYIMDQNMALAPIGVKGEICIGGDALARGYWNRPERNQAKFVPNPFSDQPGARLYRTGDLACWLPDGNIEYFGRLDDQVKIRGHRIELAEIEAVIAQSNLVKECTVITTAEGRGEQLVAYIVAKKTFDKVELKKWLEDHLPDYMVPAIYVELDEIPLTSNGKVNKKRLPAPELTTNDAANYLAPRDETEESLAAIWRDILNLNKVGVYDNFFEIGGHSLLAIRVVSAIRKEFDVRITVNVLFEYSSIADLSTYIKLLKVPLNDNDDQGEEEFELIEL
ncbi:MAG: amino acid adenylation domain-containing protein, partial [Bacteroidota bacterium]